MHRQPLGKVANRRLGPRVGGDARQRLEGVHRRDIQDGAIALSGHEAAKDLARWKALSESGAISESELDSARTRMDMAAAALEEYRVHVQKCRIQSPIDGVVNDRFVDEGEYINEGVAAVQVVDVDTVKVVVSIPEHDIHSLHTGAQVPFRVASLQNRVFTGQVSFVAELADPQANTYKAEITADNASRVLKAGMIAEVSLSRETQREVMAVPLNAVIPRQGEHVVFVAGDEYAELRVVRIRRIIGHEAILTGGLEEGDRLIVEGHRGLEDGTAISVEP